MPRSTVIVALFGRLFGRLFGLLFGPRLERSDPNKSGGAFRNCPFAA
jgi:hypothetical protein